MVNGPIPAIENVDLLASIHIPEKDVYERVSLSLSHTEGESECGNSYYIPKVGSPTKPQNN